MALFNCTECKKEISDKADKCPNCGCPIESTMETVNANKKLSSNNYKKFNFNNNEVELDYSKMMEHHNKETKKDLKSRIKKSIFFFIVASLGVVLIVTKFPNDGIVIFLMLIGMIAFVVNIYYAIRAFFSIGSKHSLREEIEKIRYQYYADNIKTISVVPYDLEYEVISAINARSKENLIKKSYLLKADALINVNVQKYTSSNTKSGKFVYANSISTEVREHENWSADAIKINSENYYAPFCKINEDGSIEMTQNS